MIFFLHELKTKTEYTKIQEKKNKKQVKRNKKFVETKKNRILNYLSFHRKDDENIN